MHKHIHIHKGIWTMLGVRWSHVLLALPFIVFLLFIGSYKQYGIILIPLRTSIVAWFKPYCFSCLFHYIFIDYEQSNALPPTKMFQSIIMLHWFPKNKKTMPSEFEHQAWTCISVMKGCVAWKEFPCLSNNFVDMRISFCLMLFDNAKALFTTIYIYVEKFDGDFFLYFPCEDDCTKIPKYL